MKLLDLTKCSEDSPNFKRHLEAFEEATVQLEKTLKQICRICEQRSTLAAQDKTLMTSLIEQFESFSHHDLILSEDDEPGVQSSLDVVMVTLNQLMDNQDRLFEQFNLAIVKPIKYFLEHDLAQVKTSKKIYHKAVADVVHLSEKFCQCKRYEMSMMNELSYQLFDARFHMHRTACDYVLDLNALHSKKTPDFLQRVVDMMTSMFSHYHVSSITTKEINPIVEGLYQTLVRIRKDYTAKDTERRTQVQTLLEQVFLARAQDLLLLHQKDLNYPQDVATASIKQHLTTHYSKISYVPKDLVLPEIKPTLVRNKSGYLMFSEQRTFGTTWIRLYFTVKRGKFESPENKAKIPISLYLKLCSVKLATPTDSERNFCFKVISPTRTLLLQAENSKILQEWIDILTNAITHAIHNQQSSFSEDFEVISPYEDTPSSPLEPSSPDPILEKPRSGTSITKQLQSIPGNELCADCQSTKPKWASVNLGVLICIECSGVHRSLGVHVSQVRSLTLDTMKPEWEQTLQDIGNAKSNSIYEEFLPSGFSRSSFKNDETRSSFIRDKYLVMKYTSPENKQHILAERDEKRIQSLAKSKAVAAAIMAGTPPEASFINVSSLMEEEPVSSNSEKEDGRTENEQGKESSCETSKESCKEKKALSGNCTDSEVTQTSNGRKSEVKELELRKNIFSSSKVGHSTTNTGVSGGESGGILHKWSKSLENVKESVVKFAKNDY